MTGLKVVDDHTFTIKTTEKVSNLPVRLGYSAFAPLPDSFFTDPKAFGEKPIGAGPFKLDCIDRHRDGRLEVRRLLGQIQAATSTRSPSGSTSDTDAAYNDVVANNLDVTDEIPAERLIDDMYKQGPARPQRRQKQSGTIATTTSFPPIKIDPNFTDPKMRQAISMAIDRDTDQQADLQRHQAAA